MSNFCHDWVSTHPGSPTVTNDMLTNPAPQNPMFWNTLFSWTELAIPGIPCHPNIMDQRQMGGHITLVLLRIAVIEEQIEKAYGQTALGSLALAFLKLGSLFAKSMARKHKKWLNEYNNNPSGGVMDGEIVGCICRSLNCARETIEIIQ